MGTPLKNPPVYFTLAQVHFNPILKLSDFLPSIQESLRQLGYADFSQQKSIAINVVIGQNGQATPTPLANDRYVFGNLSRTHTFVLDGQSITLQSTNYSSFEEFSTLFLEGLSIVHGAVKLAFTTRVGLRYLDRVMPRPGDELKDYLAVEVQGLRDRLGGRGVYSFSESMNEIGNIKLRSRVVIQDGALTFPPDLQAMNMAVTSRFLEYSGTSAVLDNDGFIESRDEYSREAVKGRVSSIHETLGAAFKATVKDHALQVWGN